MPSPDYWNMPNFQLAAEWREVDAWSQSDGYSLEADPDGTRIEKLNFVEDAILQRIGAPDTASGDEPKWQERIRAFGEANTPAPQDLPRHSDRFYAPSFHDGPHT